MNKIYFIYILVACVFCGIFYLGYLYNNFKNNKTKILQSATGDTYDIVQLSRKDLIKQKINETGLYKSYYEYLSKLIELTFDEQTPENIIHSQMSVLIIAAIVLLGFSVFSGVLFELVLLGIFGYVVYSPVLDLQNKYKKKNREFDKALPTFISHVLLVLDSGITLENSFSYAIQTMDGNSIVKREFEKLIVEMRIHSNNLSKAFMNLHQRVNTSDVEKFCNIIVSGLSNGYAMSDILRNERNRLNENLRVQIEKEGVRNKNISYVISTFLIFLPALLAFMIPLMSGTGM